jgi:hypothetical protein
MKHPDETIASPLTFAGTAKSGTIQLQVAPHNLILAGWTGRDHAAVEAHIEELGRLGVSRPRSVPIFYRVSVSLITRARTIQVYGRNSTGEAEFVLFTAEGRRWITIGSDQTDRKAEAIGVTLSKQLCSKPIGTEAWVLDEIEDHWDDLVLRSFVEIDGTRHLYQESSVRSMTAPQKLLNLYNLHNPGAWNEGWIMFCGTLPVKGELRWADAFTVELEDPVLHRVLTHSYRIEPLPDEG